MEPTPAPLDTTLYLAVLETLASPVIAVDSRGRVRLFNSAAERVSGRSKNEMLAREIWPVIHPEEREGAKIAFRRILDGAELSPIQIPWVNGEGERVDLLWSYTLVHPEEEDSPVLICTGVDLTAQKALEDRQRQLEADDAIRLAREEALRSSEARFSGIVELASDAIITISDRGKIVLFNQGARNIFGYDPTEVLGKPLDLLIPERFHSDHSRHLAAFAGGDVSARRMGERTPISGLRKSGEEFPAEASILRLQLEDELLFTVVLRDVTEQRQVEQEQRILAELGEELAASLDEPTLLRNASRILARELGDACAILVFPEEGRGRHAPVFSGPTQLQALAGGFGSDAHLALEPLGRGRAGGLASPGGGKPPPFPGHLGEVLAPLGVHSLVWAQLKGSGPSLGIILLASSTSTFSPGEWELELLEDVGRRAGIAVENARLYRNAQAALQARDDVLGVVSHDLGNPLAAIFIGVEGLERVRARSGGEGDDYFLAAIRQSADLMQSLIQDLLEVRRMEAGLDHRDPVLQPFPPLVAQSLTVIRPLAALKGIHIENDVVDAGLPQVEVDGGRMKQVLSNLLGNAVKHVPEGGEIRVSARVKGHELLICVADNGPGISPEFLPQVFDRFWRAEKTGGKGLGLGLAIAKGIVKGHGGRIWAESEPGAGSSFYFALPLPDRGES